eukprot:2105166-Rhodomonas_salina.4
MQLCVLGCRGTREDAELSGVSAKRGLCVRVARGQQQLEAGRGTGGRRVGRRVEGRTERRAEAACKYRQRAGRKGTDRVS